MLLATYNYGYNVCECAAVEALWSWAKELKLYTEKLLVGTTKDGDATLRMAVELSQLELLD